MTKTKSCAKKHRTHKHQSGGASGPNNNNKALQLALAESAEFAKQQTRENAELAAATKNSRKTEYARIARRLQEQTNLNAAIIKSQQTENARIARELQNKYNKERTHTEPHMGAAAARRNRNNNPTRRRNNNNNTRRRHEQYTHDMRIQLKKHNTTHTTIRNIDAYTVSIAQKQSECERKTTTREAIPLITDINRYVKKQYNYKWAANSCYLDSALQLFKNIPELIQTINVPSINSDVLKLCSLELQRQGNPNNNSQILMESVMHEHWGNSCDTIEFIQGILNKLHISELLYMTFIEKTYTFFMDDNTLYNINSQQSYLLGLHLQHVLYENIQAILLQQINTTEYMDPGFLKTINYEITDTTQYILIQLLIFEFINPVYVKKKLQITNLNDVLCIDGILFELISMNVHIGIFGGGHYINYSKQSEHFDYKWYKYDDIVPSDPTTLGPLLTLPKDHIPYILLYKKII